MDILFLLVPISVLLALAVMGVLAWAVWAGQFEELDTQAERILMDETELLKAPLKATDLIHINTPAGKAQETLP